MIKIIAFIFLYKAVFVGNLEFRFQVSLSKSMLTKTAQLTWRLSKLQLFQMHSTHLTTNEKSYMCPVHMMLRLLGYRNQSEPSPLVYRT